MYDKLKYFRKYKVFYQFTMRVTKISDIIFVASHHDLRLKCLSESKNQQSSCNLFVMKDTGVRKYCEGGYLYKFVRNTI